MFNEIIYGNNTKSKLINGKNYNTVCVGMPGSGKTFSYIKTNLAQMLGSYIVIDTKGKLYNEFEGKLRANGYNVLLLDFVNPLNSIRYNPLSFIRSSNDVRDIASTLVKYKRNLKNAKDIYWIDAAKQMIESYLWMLIEFGSEEEINIPTLLSLVECDCESRTDTSQFFDKLRSLNPNAICVRKRQGLKGLANASKDGITYACIQSQLASSISDLNDPDLQTMLEYNELDLTSFAYQKTALFINTSDINNGAITIIQILLSQIFRELYAISDIQPYQTFKNHIMVLLDDAATYISNIANINEVMATCRSRNISISLMLQSLDQLQDNGLSASILDNCSTNLYFGTLSPKSIHYFAELSNMSFNMIQEMKEEEVLIIRANQKSIIDKRYNVNKHPLLIR